jgi:hypothetical protein
MQSKEGLSSKPRAVQAVQHPSIAVANHLAA